MRRREAVLVLEVHAEGGGVEEARRVDDLGKSKVRTAHDELPGIFQPAVADEVRQAVELAALREGGAHPVGRKVDAVDELLPVKVRIQKQALPLDDQVQVAEQLFIAQLPAHRVRLSLCARSISSSCSLAR